MKFVNEDLTQSRIDQDQINKFRAFLDQAKTLFSAGISETVVAAAFLAGIELPRIGGHDDRRGEVGGNQIGSSQKDSEHGINQGKQWTKWKERVEKEASTSDKVYSSDLVKAMVREEKLRTIIQLNKKDKSLIHDKDQKLEAEKNKKCKSKKLEEEKFLRYWSENKDDPKFSIPPDKKNLVKEYLAKSLEKSGRGF